MTRELRSLERFFHSFMIVLFYLFGQPEVIWADTRSEQQARFIFKSLAGLPLTTSHPRYSEFVNAVWEGKSEIVAKAATKENNFISSTARQWASALLAPTSNPRLPMSDSLAMLIGAVRDNLDARLLLTGDMSYGIDVALGFRRPELGASDLSRSDLLPNALSEMLVRFDPQWEGQFEVARAGILTSREWASYHYSAGTNRRAVVAMLKSFTCRAPEQWRDLSAPTFRIRQDIDRTPGGDLRAFERECRGCHSIMDGLAGAFSGLNFDNQRLSGTRLIDPKYFAHAEVYPDGFVTQNDSFVNFMARGPNREMGWRAPSTGRGPLELGRLIASSSAFSQCVTSRVVSQVCGLDISMNDAWIQLLSRKFEANAYRIRDLFENVATEIKCWKGTENYELVQTDFFRTHMHSGGCSRPKRE